MSKTSQKRAKGSKQPKGKGARPATRNRRLTAQTRRLMGKHYASKYRVR